MCMQKSLERTNMIRKYRVKRTVIITTTDVVFEDADVNEVKEAFDNGMSLAGEISKLNFADYHDNVSYKFEDTVVEEVNME